MTAAVSTGAFWLTLRGASFPPLFCVGLTLALTATFLLLWRWQARGANDGRPTTA